MATVALHSPAGKWVLVSAILASSMAFIDSTALNVALPSLQRSLNATGPDLFWLLNAYLLILAALILVGGSLGDRIGRKKVFMTGILVFIAGSAACGFAPTILVLIISRIMQGVGGALMIPGSLSLISSSINENERGKAIGTWSMFSTMVTVGGPILGGALADAGLWRYIFFINVPIGIVALIILWFKVAETRDADGGRAIDIPGSAAIALGLALITFGFLRIPAAGFGNPQVYLTLAGGIGMLIAFIYIEKTSKHAMMPLSLFSNPTFSGVNLLTFFLYAGLGSGMLFVSLDMIQEQRYTQLQAGLTFLPFTILMILISRFAGSLADQFGPRLLLILGPATAGIGLLMLSFIGKEAQGVGNYFKTFFPGIVTLGLGMSFTVAPLTTTVMSSVSDHFSGTASGVNNALTRVSNVFANAIFGTLAVLFFAGALQKQLAGQPSMPAKTKQYILAQAANLGDAKLPPGLKDDKGRMVNLYRNGFAEAYSKIMKLSGGLALLGALVTVIFIRDSTVKRNKK
ncbi:MAG: MFS transporter [Bacteroidetes bacterium]|nr:MFS transporter [Bacteroidota bacterium]